MITLTFLCLIESAVPIINSISTAAYASTIDEPAEQQGSLNLSNNEGDSISHVMVASGSNKVFVGWVDDSLGYKAVFLAKSVDGGTSFSNATILSNNNSKTSSSPEEPQIAAAGSNVYVAWYDNITGNFDPFLAISTDNGTSFSNPIGLKEKAGVQNKDSLGEYGLITSYSHIAASGNNLYVIWYDNITGSVQSFLTKSTDNGISFSNPINFSEKAKVGTMLDIAASGNNVYVLSTLKGDVNNSNLTNNTVSNFQLLLSKSSDSGITFSKPVTITSEGGISGPPRLAVSGNNTVYVSWKEDTVEESGTKGIMKILSTKISLTKSLDGGISFSRPVTVIESKSSIGDFDIAPMRNNVYAVWSMHVGEGEFLPGVARLPGEEHILAAKNTDDGTTFNKSPIDVGKGRFPDVSVSDDNNNLYVTWLYNIGNAEIFFKKITANMSTPLMDNASLGITETNATDSVSNLGLEGQKEVYLPYENTNYGIKMQYPSSWEKVDEQIQQGTITILASFFSPAKNATEPPQNVNIGIEDLPSQTFTLDEYTQGGINQLRISLQDFNITESTENLSLGGNPAHKIIYTYSLTDKDSPFNQLPLKNMQIWTVKNGKAYIFSYGGVASQFSGSLAEAQKMIDSFEIASMTPKIKARGSIG
jgi:hypothetical protein